MSNNFLFKDLAYHSPVYIHNHEDKQRYFTNKSDFKEGIQNRIIKRLNDNSKQYIENARVVTNYLKTEKQYFENLGFKLQNNEFYDYEYKKFIEKMMILRKAVDDNYEVAFTNFYQTISDFEKSIMTPGASIKDTVDHFVSALNEKFLNDAQSSAIKLANTYIQDLTDDIVKLINNQNAKKIKSDLPIKFKKHIDQQTKELTQSKFTKEFIRELRRVISHNLTSLITKQDFEAFLKMMDNHSFLTSTAVRKRLTSDDPSVKQYLKNRKTIKKFLTWGTKQLNRVALGLILEEVVHRTEFLVGFIQEDLKNSTLKSGIDPQALKKKGGSFHGFTTDVGKKFHDVSTKLGITIKNVYAVNNLGEKTTTLFYKDNTGSSQNDKLIDDFGDSITEQEWFFIRYYIANNKALQVLSAPATTARQNKGDSLVWDKVNKEPIESGFKTGLINTKDKFFIELQRALGINSYIKALLGATFLSGVESKAFKINEKEMGSPLILWFLDKQYWTADIMEKVMELISNPEDNLNLLFKNFYNDKLFSGYTSSNLIDLFKMKKIVNDSMGNEKIPLLERYRHLLQSNEINTFLSKFDFTKEDFLDMLKNRLYVSTDMRQLIPDKY